MKTENDPKILYADIIGLPHHQSKKRRPMSLYNRAAQFAPFAALAGYEDLVAEESRLTDRYSGPEDTDALDRVLNDIASGNPFVTITYFIPDEKKDGGRYAEVSGQVKTVDAAGRKIILFAENGSSSGQEIRIDRILEIRKQKKQAP